MEPSLSPSYKFERMEEGEDGGGRRGEPPPRLNPAFATALTLKVIIT